ncbi:MAG: hypothetical protein JW769_04805 [Parachlamydiales bacterium]|nr:hypothetical protein [Parachlamydiales bacterium]
MRIFRYVIEGIVLFGGIWILNAVLNHYLQKKMKPTAAAFYVFVLMGLFLFLTTPYVIAFVNPAWMYMPFLLFWLVMNLMEANKNL